MERRGEERRGAGAAVVCSGFRKQLFLGSPSLAVKAQYLRHCNYWYGKDERSQLLAEEKEVTK